MDPERKLTIMIYCAGVVYFTFIVIAVVYSRPDDGQLFSMFSGAFSTFMGALIGYLQGSADRKKPLPPGSSTTSTTEVSTQTTVEPPK